MCVVTPLKAFLAENLPQIHQSHAATARTDGRQLQQPKQELPWSLQIIIQVDNPASRPLSPSSKDRLDRRMRSQSCGLTEHQGERRRRRCRWESSTAPSSTTDGPAKNQDEPSSSSQPPSRDTAPAFRRTNTYPQVASTSTTQQQTNSNASPPRRPQRRRSNTSMSPDTSPLKERVPRHQRTSSRSSTSVPTNTAVNVVASTA